MLPTVLETMQCACGAVVPKAKDGRCKTCRLHAIRPQLYRFTEETDAAIKAMYRQAKRREDVTAGLDKLAARFAMPRRIVANRAHAIGARYATRIPWSPGEVQRLQDLAGEMPLRKLAYKMGRSYGSIRQKLFTLGVTNEQLTSYSYRQLGELMGVTHNQVSRWVASGALHQEDGRVPEWSAARFCWEHMGKYRFAGTDQEFLARMLRMNAPTKFIGKPNTIRRAA